MTLFSVWSLGSTTEEAGKSLSVSDKQPFLISRLLPRFPSQAGIKLPSAPRWRWITKLKVTRGHTKQCFELENGNAVHYCTRAPSPVAAPSATAPGWFSNTPSGGNADRYRCGKQKRAVLLPAFCNLSRWMLSCPRLSLPLIQTRMRKKFHSAPHDSTGGSP